MCGVHCSRAIDDVRKKKKKREQTASLPSFVLWLSLSSPTSYPAIETGANNRFAVFWLFVMFAESQIKACERDPENCKNGCETLFFGEHVIQAADLEKDCNSFMFVLRVWGITLPSFFSGTGLLLPIVCWSFRSALGLIRFQIIIRLISFAGSVLHCILV